MPLLHRILRFPLTRIAICIGFLLLGVVIQSFRPLGLPRTHLFQQFVMVLFGFLGLAFVSTVIERRPLSEAGLGLKGWLTHTLGGLALGAAMIAAVVGVLAMAGWYRIEGLNVAAFALLPGMALAMLLGAAFEEVLLRGVIFRILEDWLGSWPALVISALLFGAAHLGNRGATVMAAVAIAIEAGLLLAAAYMLTRSLWLAVGIHWGWNLAEGPLLGTAVSGGLPQGSLVKAAMNGPALWTGGAFGPEAGLAALLVGAGVGAVLLGSALRRGRGMAPSWVRRRTA